MTQNNITVKNINNRSVEDYSENLLRTSSNQVIKGFYTFTKASIGEYFYLNMSLEFIFKLYDYY